MAIEIRTGVPGSGKTYGVVHAMNELSKSDKPFVVLHNIEGLKLEDNRFISIDFTSDFFRNDAIKNYIFKLRSERSLSPDVKIYIYIDEAQRYFPPELKDSDVLFFFDYHRHYGVDIVLITQHEKKISYKISTLAEVEIRAASGRINPFGRSFVYRHMSGGEHFNTSRIKKDNSIFALYTSFQAGSGKQQKTKLIYIVYALPWVAVGAWVLFFKVFAGTFDTVKDRAGLLPPDGPVAPASVSSAAPAPVVSSEMYSRDFTDSVNSTSYCGPVVLEYSPGRDSVRVTDDETGLDVWVSVADFVAQYPPHLYGYGYFHSVGRRFVQLSADASQYIYPVKNAVYIADAAPVSSAPAPVVAEKEYPLEFENRPEMPDRFGYRRSDYEKVYARRHGMKYEAKTEDSPLELGASNASLQLN